MREKEKQTVVSSSHKAVYRHELHQMLQKIRQQCIVFDISNPMVFALSQRHLKIAPILKHSLSILIVYSSFDCVLHLQMCAYTVHVFRMLVFFYQ